MVPYQNKRGKFRIKQETKVLSGTIVFKYKLTKDGFWLFKQTLNGSSFPKGWHSVTSPVVLAALRNKYTEFYGVAA